MDAIRRAATKTAAPPPKTERATSAAQEASQSRVSRQQQDSPEDSQAATLFNRVDSDGSGRISFDEFVDWWSHRRLSTGHTLDSSVVAKMQQQWNELDRDGSGDLDKAEFESLMAELATSEWREAFDNKKQKVYYYNTRTKETSWRQPDADAAIADFMATNGLAAPRKPPDPSTLRPPIQRGHAERPRGEATQTLTCQPRRRSIRCQRQSHCRVWTRLT